MASPKPVIQYDGQAPSVQQLNLAMTGAAHADDYVFAELLKLPSFGGSAVAKAILPYQSTELLVALVEPGVVPATSPIVVSPFRAVVGTRVLATSTPAAPPPTTLGDPVITSGAEQNYRDIRSAVLATVQSNGSLGYGLAPANFPANSSGNPRWDLVYAVVYIDQPNNPSNLMVKPATAGTVSPVSGSTAYTTTVGLPAIGASPAVPPISVINGTPGATPAQPSLPADVPGSGIFYIALAYALIPNGYTLNGAIPVQQIQTVAPVYQMAARVGGNPRRPANYTTSAANFANAWSSAASRPPLAAPPTMTGGEAVHFPIDTSNALCVNGLVIDNSIDWRKRIFKSTAFLAMTASPGFAWQHGISGTTGYALTPSAGVPGAGGAGTNYVSSQGGQSFVDDALAFNGSSGAGACVLYLANANTPLIASGAAIGVFVDQTTGALTLFVSGTPGVRMWVWLEATGSFDNP